MYLFISIIVSQLIAVLLCCLYRVYMVYLKTEQY